MVLVKGIAVNGEYVENLEDKTFVIVSKPTYEEFKEQSTGITKEKAKLIIKLADGAIMDYYPNKTALKTIANKNGYEMDLWEGLEFEFSVIPQMVSGKEQKVLYIKRE